MVILLADPQNYKGEQDAQSSSAVVLTDLFPSHNKVQAFTSKKQQQQQQKQNWNQPTKCHQTPKPQPNVFQTKPKKDHKSDICKLTTEIFQGNRTLKNQRKQGF